MFLWYYFTMGSRGPKSKLEPFNDDIRRMYVNERMTDQQIAEALPVQVTAAAIGDQRKRIGLPTDKARGRYGMADRYEQIKDELPAVWEASFEDKVSPFGGVIRQGSAQRVAEHYGVSASTAIKWLKRAGLMADRPTVSSPVAQKAKNMYLAGTSVEEVAAKLGINTVTVSRHLKTQGVAIVAPQHRRTVEQQVLSNQAISATKATPEYRERELARNLAKFGVAHASQRHLSAETMAIVASPESLTAYLEESGIATVGNLHQALGCSYSFIERKLKSYGLWDRLEHFVSAPEEDLRNLFREWEVDIVLNVRDIIAPLEIDVYCPALSLGVEFNGDYWHSGKERLYHQRKSLMAAEKGVFLYHVFEYEWNDDRKRRAIVGQLKNLAGYNSRSIGARSCEIVEVEPEEKNEFLDLHHVQGQDKSVVKLGLRHEGELVAVMTFGKPRFSTRYQWEISRYATAAGVNVPGGAARLFKRFLALECPQSVVSYSDIAKARGGMYEALGFVLDHVSEPNYVWTNFVDIKTRYQTQMPGEVQEMTSRGYVQIFDSGNRVWVWRSDL